ncbi:MAG: N-acetyl-D-glucosamine transporter [Burkholderiales bacterium]|jgi:PTS system N-acetylglucosamine-specific IIC component|nr:N-acetyl-D-glucosamine transporter [Burkholderiales bacterium]
MKYKFDDIHQLGRALMLPIALLPVAGILLRLGQPDLLNIVFIANAGNSIFVNLPLLFALGVAVGLAKDNNGTAALAAAVGYFIMTTVLLTIDKGIHSGVLGGVLIGVIAARFYNRYKSIELPEYLAFFGGKRFVPIVTGGSAVLLGMVMGYIWPLIQSGIDTAGVWLIKSGPLGLFFYGVLNRILLITGLHHILNNLVWFVFGDFKNVTGVIVHGDVARFMSGDKTAGLFMSGYFPIMMFGLPAACLAMYTNARPENRRAVSGLFISMALTSFLTGVTEPVEFSFVFLAPVLFFIHAVLTGLSMALMSILNVHMGFTFSAGLIDYVLFYKHAVNPLFLLPVGVVFFLIYYVAFSLAIRRFNLATPGRDVGGFAAANIAALKSRGLQFIESLGGSSNLIAVEACTTRLRLTVKDSGNINRDMLKQLGARGVIAINHENLQVILGTTAEIIASEIRDSLVVNNAPSRVKSSVIPGVNVVANNLPDAEVDADNVEIASQIIHALGGKGNIDNITLVAITRLRCCVKDNTRINLTQLPRFLKVIDIDNKVKQIYIGNKAEKIYARLINLI